MNRLWVSWEVQRRNEGLAKEFECELLVANLPGRGVIGRSFRYLFSSLITISRLISSRPSVVFAQCPSLLLGFLLEILRLIFRYQLILDFHNSALESAQRGGVIGTISRYLIRRASGVIVSNRELVKIVEEFSGEPLVLADPLPVLQNNADLSEHQDYQRPWVTFISSFAADEPFDQVVEAVGLLEKDITLFVTGNRVLGEKQLNKVLLQLEDKHSDSVIRRIRARVILTGFISRNKYDTLISNSDLLIDLTTREGCLVCGAYEALAAGVPVVLSDTAILREKFAEGFYFSKNDSSSLLAVIENGVESGGGAGVAEFRNRFVEEWEKEFYFVCQKIR